MSFLSFQIDEVLEGGVGDLKDKIPILLVMNKKDLIKPGEIAKKLEVCISIIFWPDIILWLSYITRAIHPFFFPLTHVCLSFSFLYFWRGMESSG